MAQNILFDQKLQATPTKISLLSHEHASKTKKHTFVTERLFLNGWVTEYSASLDIWKMEYRSDRWRLFKTFSKTRLTVVKFRNQRFQNW